MLVLMKSPVCWDMTPCENLYKSDKHTAAIFRTIKGDSVAWKNVLYVGKTGKAVAVVTLCRQAGSHMECSKKLRGNERFLECIGDKRM
jgi:hypothetical protein